MNDILNKLDPRTKILLIPVLSLLTFVINKLPAAALLLALFIFLRLNVKIPLQNVKLYIKLTFVIILFILILQMLFAPGERYILNPLIPHSIPYIGGNGSLKWDGVIITLIIICRLSTLFIILPVFIATTKPYEIVMGLTKLGFNYRTSYIIITTFNLIPQLKEDARTIMDAQKLRGVRIFEEGSFIEKIKAYPSLAVPLVLGAMRKAQHMGTAMDARAFGAYKERTWLLELKMKTSDYMAFIICISISAIMLVFNFFLV